MQQQMEVNLEEIKNQGKQSETKMLDSFMAQTKQLEQTKILLEESKLEIAALREKVAKLEDSPSGQKKVLNSSQSFIEDYYPSRKEAIEAQSLIKERDLLKYELKLVTEAEENGKKAMDDLALALKEVATEANQANEKLGVTRAELEYAKEEAEKLKMMLTTSEDRYKALLDEARKEADTYKNTAERLRLEAEDSLLAWNERETGFVDCVKIAEEERSAAQEENTRLLELLTAAEKKAAASKVETQNVRDILKQALNEANVAKEVAAIAQVENSQLKDSLTAKDFALNLLAKEKENLMKNVSAAGFEKEEKEKSLSRDPSGRKMKTHKSISNKEHKDGNLLVKAFSLRLKEVKIPNKHNKDNERSPGGNDEALRDSIFDIVDSQDTAAVQLRRNSGDFNHIDGTRFDDSENDKISGRKRALLRKFGDLINRRRNGHRKEPASIE